LSLFCNLKTPKVSNSIIGENLPNLITLVGCPGGRRKFTWKYLEILRSVSHNYQTMLFPFWVLYFHIRVLLFYIWVCYFIPGYIISYLGWYAVRMYVVSNQSMKFCTQVWNSFGYIHKIGMKLNTYVGNFQLEEQNLWETDLYNFFANEKAARWQSQWNFCFVMKRASLASSCPRQKVGEQDRADYRVADKVVLEPEKWKSCSEISFFDLREKSFDLRKVFM
jgi:hypothetical protein